MKLKLLLYLFASNILAGPLMAQLVIANKPASVRAATYYSLTVTVNGAKVGNGISWTVAGIAGGNSTVGTASGTTYYAPAYPPAGTVTLIATSTTNATRSRRT